MSKTRIGVIGAGWWATTCHLPALAARDDVELVAVCRLGNELLQDIKKKFGFAFATEDYRELLDHDLDGVVVTSPHHRHFEHARAALENGCHVLCEKPMTLHAREAWELVELAKKRRLEIMIPYGWNYKPFNQTAKQLMDDGIVGDIEYITCHMASPSRTFFAGKMEPPPRYASDIQPDPSTWCVKEHGGGYAHGQITHSTGLLFWLTNLRASEVTAFMTSPDAAVDMYNAAAARFDGGAIGVFSGAATLPDSDKFQVDVRIFGNKGVLLLDMERERLDVRRHDGSHQHIDIQAGEGDYTCDHPPVHFIDLIQGRARNDSSGEIAARTVELIDAMFQSAEQGGRPVKVYR
jgi:predicted dehydrogenase